MANTQQGYYQLAAVVFPSSSKAQKKHHYTCILRQLVLVAMSLQRGSWNVGSIQHRNQVSVVSHADGPVWFPSWCIWQTERCACSGATLKQVLSISRGKDRKMVPGFCILQAFRHKLRREHTSNTKWHILEDVGEICSLSPSKLHTTSVAAIDISFDSNLQGNTSFVLLPILSLQLAFILPAGVNAAFLLT